MTRTPGMALLSLALHVQAVARAGAGEANVLAVRAVAMGEGRHGFEVTVRHADRGWEHYADRWEVVAPGGGVLGTRVPPHPHVREQPFTRRLEALAVPAGLSRVAVRAHDKEQRVWRCRADGGAAALTGRCPGSGNSLVSIPALCRSGF